MEFFVCFYFTLKPYMPGKSHLKAVLQHSWVTSSVCKNWMTKWFALCSRFTSLVICRLALLFQSLYWHLGFQELFSIDKISIQKSTVLLKSRRRDCFLLHTLVTLVRGSAVGKAAERGYCGREFLLILEHLLLCRIAGDSCKLFAPAFLVSAWPSGGHGNRQSPALER